MTLKWYKRLTINGKQIKEHRYIMEQFLGRKLTSKEIIHHKDGNIHNNDISNLFLTTQKEHNSIHHPKIRITIKCENCGISFERINSKIKLNKKRKNKTFCSKNCTAKFYRKSTFYGQTTITNNKIEQIRNRLNKNESAYKISREVGIARNTVYRYRDIFKSEGL